MEIGKRTEGSPNRRKNGWMESNVFPTTTGPPSIFRPLHRAFSPFFPPPLSSTVACNFKFHFPRLSLLVSSALEGPLNRVFSLSNPHPPRLPLDLDPLSILSVYVGMHARRTPWEFVLGRAFNDTSEKF